MNISPKDESLFTFTTALFPQFLYFLNEAFTKILFQ